MKNLGIIFIFSKWNVTMEQVKSNASTWKTPGWRTEITRKRPVV